MLFLPLLMVGLSACQSEPELSIPESFLGNWEALSRNHMSISGNMQVSQGKLKFQRKGVVDFEIMDSSPTKCLLKIEREVDDGQIMLIELREDGDLDVAYYESLAMATEDRKESYSNAKSWGIYIKSE